MKLRVSLFWLLVLSFLILRLVHLEADPPSVPNGQGGLELVVEAPAKAYEARKLALFGKLSTSEADAYRFWSVQAPAYVFPLGGFMSVFGAGYAQVRIFGVLFGLVGYVLLLGMLHRRVGVVAFAVVGLLMCVHFYYLHYLRAGLLEPVLNTWLIIMVFAALRSTEDARWLTAVPVAWAAAFLTKQTAIAFLPLAVFLAGWGLSAQRADRRRTVLGLVAVTAVCAVGLLAFVSSDDYARTVAWNVQHLFHAQESFRGPDPSLLSLSSRTVKRLFDWHHWKQGVLWVIPVCLPFIALHIARHALALFRHRRMPSPLSLTAMLWLLLGLGALFAIEHARGRFSHILLPPAFVLFGLELDFWISKIERRRFVAVAVMALVAASLLTHGRWSWSWLLRPTYVVRDANRELSAFLDADDAVLGFRAPLLAFDSQADVFYVKRHFNDSKSRMSQFDVTHLLFSKNEIAARLVRKHFSEAFASKQPLTDVRFGGTPYVLYELQEPLSGRLK